MTGHIVLVGMMGSGKTTVGRALAARLGMPYWDNDVALEDRTGSDARTLVECLGAGAEHALEGSLLERVLDGGTATVIAAAGSAVLDPRLRARLHGEWTVWLRGRPETLAARVRGGGWRPFLDGDAAATLRHLAAERAPLYAEVASATVDVDGLSPGAVVERILALHRAPDRTP